jgi:predicted Rossmann-fold nucleotide-binding protein
MAGLPEVFVALPGGFGTLEEFCEVVTWPRLGLHAKPCAILNILGYYSPLLRMFDDAVEEQFLKPENRALVLAQDGLLTCCKHLRNGVRRTLRNGLVGIRRQSARCSQRRRGKLRTPLGLGKVRRGRAAGN